MWSTCFKIKTLGNEGGLIWTGSAILMVLDALQKWSARCFVRRCRAPWPGLFGLSRQCLGLDGCHENLCRIRNKIGYRAGMCDQSDAPRGWEGDIPDAGAGCGRDDSFMTTHLQMHRRLVGAIVGGWLTLEVSVISRFGYLFLAVPAGRGAESLPIVFVPAKRASR